MVARTEWSRQREGRPVLTICVNIFLHQCPVIQLVEKDAFPELNLMPVLKFIE